jgi:hypothetical protein
MDDINLKLIESFFKLMILCLNNIYKHEICLGNDLIERMEEKNPPPPFIEFSQARSLWD